jgi:hypothetical protein
MAEGSTQVDSSASSVRREVKDFLRAYPFLEFYLSRALKEGEDSVDLSYSDSEKTKHLLERPELKRLVIASMEDHGVYQLHKENDAHPFLFRRRPETYPDYPQKEETVVPSLPEKEPTEKRLPSTEPKTQKKIEYSAAASLLQQKATEIETWIRNNYSTLITNKELSEEEIQALVGTLIRVDSVTGDYPINRTPSRLYDWAYTRSSITFPYPSLKLASGHVMFDKDFNLKLPWGFSDGKFTFPSKESLDDDSSYWGKLYDLITVLGGKVEWNATTGPSVPDIGETDLLKNDYFSLVYLRLVELAKSPSSATLRSGTKTKLDLVKNHVDYVVLDLILKTKLKEYGNLPLSSSADNCRRVLTTSRTVTVGKKTQTEIVKSYNGYALAEGLSAYQSGKISKSPEGEPFFKLILEIIKLILAKQGGDYTLPKSLFNPPSTVLRSLLRKGPERKKQSGKVSSVTYVPFSFVKSQECLRMNEVIRKTLTKVGSTISGRVDSVNNMPIKEANAAIPWMEQYVAFCYSVSDQLRKEWQLAGLIPSDLSELVKVFNEEFFEVDDDAKEIFMDAARKWEVKMTPNYKDSGEQASLVETLKLAQEEKKKARRKAA